MMLSKKQIGMVALSVIIAILIPLVSMPLTSFFSSRLLLNRDSFKAEKILKSMPIELSDSAPQEEREEYNQKMKVFKSQWSDLVQENKMLDNKFRTYCFYIFFCMGLAWILLGSLIIPIDFLGAGCIFGGIVTLIIGYPFVWDIFSAF